MRSNAFRLPPGGGLQCRHTARLPRRSESRPRPSCLFSCSHISLRVWRFPVLEFVRLSFSQQTSQQVSAHKQGRGDKPDRHVSDTWRCPTRSVSTNTCTPGNRFPQKRLQCSSAGANAAPSSQLLHPLWTFQLDGLTTQSTYWHFFFQMNPIRSHLAALVDRAININVLHVCDRGQLPYSGPCIHPLNRHLTPQGELELVFCCSESDKIHSGDILQDLEDFREAQLSNQFKCRSGKVLTQNVTFPKSGRELRKPDYWLTGSTVFTWRLLLLIEGVSGIFTNQKAGTNLILVTACVKKESSSQDSSGFPGNYQTSLTI